MDRRIFAATTIIATVLCAALIINAVATMTASPRIVATTGKVTKLGVEVFWDVACTNPVNAIDWGIVDPGAVVQKIVYIRNNGTFAEDLSAWDSNWVPDVGGWSWNRNGTSLDALGVIDATLTFTLDAVVPDGVVTFAFDVTFSGSKT